MSQSESPAISIMPASFGPAGGPRQAPDAIDYRPGPIRFKRHVVRFVSNEDQLGPLLPRGLQLRGEPMAQFHFFCLRDIPWLAGRGYNLLSLMIPVSHPASGVDGVYAAVMWENMGDPIITGREQLGHPKLSAQLPEPREWNGETHLRASWEDFTFAEMRVACTEEADAGFVAEIGESLGAGIIAHKYVPRSGRWSEADADYLTLSPALGSSLQRDPQPAPTIRRGAGSIAFTEPAWQDMPTQFHIVRRLAALEQRRPLDAFVMEGTTYLDFYDQRILD